MLLSPLSCKLSDKLGINSDNFVIVINQPDNYFGMLSDLPHGVRFLQVEDNVMVDSIHIFALNQQSLIHELFLVKPLLKDDGKLWLFYPKKTSRIRTDLDLDFLIHFSNDIHLTNIQLIDFDIVWSGMEFRLEKYEG